MCLLKLQTRVRNLEKAAILADFGLSLSRQMFRVLTAYVLACVVVEHSSACLRDTKAQVEARYGHSNKAAEAQSGEEALEYRYKDFIVIVTFVGGKSAQEMFVHQDFKTPLTESEIKLLLDMNSLGQRWEKSPEIPVWSLGRSDPHTWLALAAYLQKSPQYVAPGLGIMTADYAKKHGFMPND
jgi:hypothetical protein